MHLACSDTLLSYSPQSVCTASSVRQLILLCCILFLYLHFLKKIKIKKSFLWCIYIRVYSCKHWCARACCLRMTGWAVVELAQCVFASVPISQQLSASFTVRGKSQSKITVSNSTWDPKIDAWLKKWLYHFLSVGLFIMNVKLILTK